MSNYRRSKEGQTYFFTVVTYQRQPFLCIDKSVATLKNVIHEVLLVKPFEINAWVQMPDHLHCIWTLPECDNDYSKRWGLIKVAFTKSVGKELVGNAHPTESRLKHRESAVWQRRFWEHQIRSDKDYDVHCNYIHYNPVKHGLARSPAEWPFSTFQEFVRKGVYEDDWGSSEPLEFPEDIGGE